MELQRLFDTLAISCQQIEHPPLHTCDDADRLAVQRPGTRLKHLFLRDNYGRRHILLVTAPDREVDLPQLSRRMKVSRLGLASAERLQRYLGVRPGCVSMLALMNDTSGLVELWVDEAIWHRDRFHCHPLVNTATWVVPAAGLRRFLRYTGHAPEVIAIPKHG